MENYNDILDKSTDSIHSIRMIPVEWLIPSGTSNIRGLKGHYTIDLTNPKDALLMNSIPKDGILVPITAYWGGVAEDGLPEILINEGDRRTSALLRLHEEGKVPESLNGVEYIKDGVLRMPTIVIGESGDEVDVKELRRKQYLYNSALSLTAFQVAKYFVERVEMGDKVKDLAKLENRTSAWVSMHVTTLTGSGEQFHNLLEQGTIGFTLGYEIVKAAPSVGCTPYELYERACSLLETLTLASFSNFISEIMKEEGDDEEEGRFDEDGDCFEDMEEEEGGQEVDPMPEPYFVSDVLSRLNEMTRDNAHASSLSGLLADIVEALSEGTSHEKSAQELYDQLQVLINTLPETVS